MNTLKLIDTITTLFSELLCLVAIILLKIWYGRQVIITLAILTFLICGIAVYGLQTAI